MLLLFFQALSYHRYQLQVLVTTVCCDIPEATLWWQTRNVPFVVTQLYSSLIMAGQQPVTNDDVAPRVNSTAAENTSASIESGSSTVLDLILATVMIALIIVLAMIIRWIYRKRKYNRLRHYLIPKYTFDPNEEETWNVDFDNQESAIFAGSSPQGYQSMDAKNNVSAPSTTNHLNH